MKKTLYLFCILIGIFLIPQNIKAQRTQIDIPSICYEDRVKVYPAFSYVSLTSERLNDRRSIPLQEKDIKLLNELFKSANKYRQLFTYLNHRGIFIEVTNKQGQRCGFYIENKQYTYFYGDQHQTFHITLKNRPQIKKLIEYYQQQLPDNTEVIHHNYTKANLEVRPLNGCMFNPVKRMVTVTFYTHVDSLSVIPIEYRVFKHKKKGIQVWRDISPWSDRPYCGTDKQGNIRVQVRSGEIISIENKQDTMATGILKDLFPRWEKMSNAERLKILDEYFESYALSIYQKQKKQKH